MNLVGNIITVLILLLSVCFMMIGIMVNASHQNWKGIAIENKKMIDQLNANRGDVLQQAESGKEIIRKERVARMLRIQQLEAQLVVGEQEFNRVNEALAEQRVTAQQSFAVVQQSEERIAEQDNLIDTLENQLRVTNEEVLAQRLKVTDMTAQIFNLQTQVRGLEGIRNDLAEELALRTKVMTLNGLEPNDATAHIPRELDGRVTAIRDGTIAVSLGLDDGLRKGHTVDIFRDGQFVGAAVVIETENNRSAARIDRNLTKFPVQLNDEITTKWVVSDNR